MEILISVAAKVAESLVAPLQHLACLLFESKTTTKELRKECDKLQESHDQLKTDCEEAVRCNGEEIREAVTHWLHAAQDTLTRVGTWLESVNDENAMTSWLSPYNWGWRYKQNKEAIRKKAEIRKLLERHRNISRLTRITAPRGIELIPRDNFSTFNSVDRAFKEIVEALENRGTNMVGVYGMGGIGKTTLVKEVGVQAKREGLFSMVVMAVVSQSPNIYRIQTQLADQLDVNYRQETEVGRADQLRTRMKHEEKILVILDDVWRKIDLREIGIPYGNDHNGCKVLLSTRREQVCVSMDCQKKVCVTLLEDDEAWQLFKQNTGKILADPSPELEPVAKKVCRECAGLPLALLVVGRALRDKRLVDWKLAAEKLERARLGEITGADTEANVYERIKLSYDFLKADPIKKCFLLCSLFPEDHEINIDELALYAIGFGLFDDGPDSFMSAKVQMECTIRDLIESSLLMTSNTRSCNVKMHDVVRDAALWITSEGEDVFLVPIPSDKNWTRSPRSNSATAISLLACPRNQQFSSHSACPRLKILLFAQSARLCLRDHCFQGMKTLQVLDLTSRAKAILELPLPVSLQDLDNLRTLLLRRWSLQGDISMIGRLSNLEILSLSGCTITELPMALGNLSELRFLDLSGCKELSNRYTAVQAQLTKLEDIWVPGRAMSVLVDDEE
uniref:NB-ARC domain-containing protein n=1 Tax=Opuntia streptacantha TaxID=393608 RepID=A0A7C9AXD0_OPUST